MSQVTALHTSPEFKRSSMATASPTPPLTHISGPLDRDEHSLIASSLRDQPPALLSLQGRNSRHDSPWRPSCPSLDDIPAWQSPPQMLSMNVSHLKKIAQSRNEALAAAKRAKMKNQLPPDKPKEDSRRKDKKMVKLNDGSAASPQTMRNHQQRSECAEETVPRESGSPVATSGSRPREDGSVGGNGPRQTGGSNVVAESAAASAGDLSSTNTVGWAEGYFLLRVCVCVRFLLVISGKFRL